MTYDRFRMYIRCTAESRDFQRQKLLKHPQNSYSIERVCRELSKTPSYALIDAIGGSIHHFECAGRAFSGPNQTARAAHSRVPDPLPLMRPCGPALARLVRWTGKRTRSALKVMVWATQCTNQGARRRFGRLMSCPFDRVWVLRVCEMFLGSINAAQ